MAYVIERAILLLVTLTSTIADDQSAFNQIKKTTTTVTVTNEVNYMPPMMIIGFNNGTIVRCPQSSPASCEIFRIGSYAVTSMLVHGEYLFASLSSGQMLRCRWHQTHSCAVFHQTSGGPEMNGLAISQGYIYAGLGNGTILKCDMNTPQSCTPFAHVGSKITSLAAFGSYIYAGYDSESISRCTKMNCTLFCHLTGSIVTSIQAIGDTFYSVSNGGFIMYGSLESNQCKEYSIPGGGYRHLSVFDSKLYVIQDPGVIFTIDPATHERVQLVQHKEARSISFAHGTYAMQKQYELESRKCIWRGFFQCPPTVIYYDVHERLPMEISVVNGSLYNSQRNLLDTSTADEAYSMKAAVFVMGPDGQILVSNFHKTGLLHTSSLLAGNPVSGAGLIVVAQGKIRSMTACSIHYRPDQDLNSQVIKALYQKGYMDQIDSKPCTYNSMLCVQDSSNAGNKYF